MGRVFELTKRSQFREGVGQFEVHIILARFRWNLAIGSGGLNEIWPAEANVELGKPALLQFKIPFFFSGLFGFQKEIFPSVKLIHSGLIFFYKGFEWVFGGFFFSHLFFNFR